MPPFREPLKTIDFINYRSELFEIDKTAKIISDITRICEIEDTVTQWLDYRYKADKVYAKFNLDKLRDYFSLDKILVGTIDSLALKMQLTVKKEGFNYIGSIPCHLLGKAINIKKRNEQCLISIKRFGFVIDRNRGIDLRIGDKLVLYIS